MPCYDYQCKCGRKFEAFARVAERNAQSCPACGKKCESLAFSGNGPQVVTSKSAAWGTKAGRSHRFAFDPQARGRIAQHCPTLASQIGNDGTVNWRSDADQKKAYREMAGEKARFEANEAADLERRIRNHGPDQPAHDILRPGFASDLADEEAEAHELEGAQEHA